MLLAGHLLLEGQGFGQAGNEVKGGGHLGPCRVRVSLCQGNPGQQQVGLGLDGDTRQLCRLGGTGLGCRPIPPRHGHPGQTEPSRPTFNVAAGGRGSTWNLQRQANAAMDGAATDLR